MKNAPQAAGGIRLNKLIADSGFCSRRKADALIAAGQVTVNGEVCRDLATRPDGNATIAINGKPLATRQKHVYLLLNKPVHVVSTASDPQGRTTVLDLLPKSWAGMRLYPVGRLDYFSEGLLLLTNDGQLAHRLMHPRFHLPKRYEVLVRGNVAQAALEEFRAGMILPEGERLMPVAVEARQSGNGDTLLKLELRQGINRQIRRMCASAGLTILRLMRTGEGPLELGNLTSGKVRILSAAELAQLRAALPEK